MPVLNEPLHWAFVVSSLCDTSRVLRQRESICTPIPSIGTIDGNMDMDTHGYTVMPAVLSSDCFNLDGCVSLGSYCFGETTRSFLRVAKLVLEKGCILLFLTITQSGERTQLAMPSTCSIRDQM